MQATPLQGCFVGGGYPVYIGSILILTSIFEGLTVQVLFQVFNPVSNGASTYPYEFNIMSPVTAITLKE